MEDQSVNIQLQGISDDKPIIKVIGVGGGGGNAANHMFDQGICDVDFVICNTDKMALENSPIPVKVQLGEKGLGAGNKPQNGAAAAIESLPKIQEILEDSTEMVFITAGMGGGTGTGAAPIIAQAAKDMGILTIGIVTIPFLFEGRRRVQQAIAGVEEMRKHVDAILVVNTERINNLYSDLSLENAFAKADDVLTIAAKGIAELITVHGKVNVDLEDVKTVMKDSGDAVMGSARCTGEHRASDAIEAALHSPLLQRTNLEGARNVLMNIAYSNEYPLMVNELQAITAFIDEQIDTNETETIWGCTVDNTLGDAVNVTIVATGFDLTNAERYGEETAGKYAPKPEPKPEVVRPTVNLEDYYGTPNIQRQPKSQYNPAPANNVAPVQDVIDVPQTQPKRMINFDAADDELENYESQPAFMRKKAGTVQKGLYNGEVSNFSLSGDGDSVEIKDTNNFLHNNVD